MQYRDELDPRKDCQPGFGQGAWWSAWEGRKRVQAEAELKEAQAKTREDTERILREAREWFLRSDFGILGVSLNASQQEIKRAYRRLAKQHLQTEAEIPKPSSALRNPTYA